LLVAKYAPENNDPEVPDPAVKRQKIAAFDLVLGTDIACGVPSAYLAVGLNPDHLCLWQAIPRRPSRLEVVAPLGPRTSTGIIQ
jgi:hypothetical protein